MTLKTLKDLEQQDWSTHKEDKELVNAVFFDLRKEAINHIKELKSYLNTHSFGTVNQNFTEFNRAYAEGKIDWIKYFFNIKEEELK